MVKSTKPLELLFLILIAISSMTLRQSLVDPGRVIKKRFGRPKDIYIILILIF